VSSASLDMLIMNDAIIRIAGADTTSTTLAYLFWELSRRADIAKKLQAELEDAMPDSRHLPDISVIQELPYLNAFIKEGEQSSGEPVPHVNRV
jgi:cytochrome P450